jgi:hypothetical protein
MTADRMDAAVLRVGQRFESAVCSTNVIVLDPGTARELPTCGGKPMRPGSLIRCSAQDQRDPVSVRMTAGVVYSDAMTGLKLACTRSGSGVLGVAGREMVALSSHRHSVGV